MGSATRSLRMMLGSRTVQFGAAGILVTLLMVELVIAFGNTDHFELLGVPTANRTLNQLTAVVLTCMALVVPLTSNLYTPKLVKLYVTHPLIVSGLTVLILSNLLVMAASFFPAGHPFAPLLFAAIAVSYLLILSATLPFLYGISRFLRPSFFLPMLARSGVQQLRRMERPGDSMRPTRRLFGTIDVLTNIALTGMARGDRQLVLLALHSLTSLLEQIIRHDGRNGAGWRAAQAHFVPGLAREGQQYLVREGVWPEAYMLAQMLKVMEVATKRQHEILAELASQLVRTAQLAFSLQQEAIVELHVMAFNTLMREAIDERDLRRFQNVSYQYRMLLVSFRPRPPRMLRDAGHLVHYGHLASKQGLAFGLETVIYDMGDVVLSVGRDDQAQALALLDGAAGGLFRQSLGAGGGTSRIAWRTVIRLYWEARAAGLAELSERVRNDYLRDDAAHREQIARALGENRELHFEFNDRLMRFAHLSVGAEALAREFARQPAAAEE